jgi:hypothetical protein
MLTPTGTVDRLKNAGQKYLNDPAFGMPVTSVGNLRMASQSRLAYLQIFIPFHLVIVYQALMQKKHCLPFQMMLLEWFWHLVASLTSVFHVDFLGL